MGPPDILSLLNIPEEIKSGEILKLKLRFASVVIEVRSNDSGVIRQIKKYHGAHLAEDDDSSPSHVVYFLQAKGFKSNYAMRDFSRQGKIKEEFVDIFEGRLVRKKKYGIEIYFDGLQHIMIGDISGNLHQIILFLNVVFARTFLARGGYSLFNVMAVEKEGEVIAFAGSTSPTLLLNFLDAGFLFCTSDRLMVRATDEDVNAVGYPIHPRLKPGYVMSNPRIAGILPGSRINEYQGISFAKLWMLDDLISVDVDKVYGSGTHKLRGNLKAFHLLEWDQNSSARTKITPISTDELLENLPVYYKDLGVFDLNNTRGERHITPDLDHLRRIFDPLYRARVSGRLDVEKLLKEINGRC